MNLASYSVCGIIITWWAVMYHSESGGCCDCGDRAAWREFGYALSCLLSPSLSLTIRGWTDKSLYFADWEAVTPP